MTWDGTPRRADDSPESVAIRLALLEKQASDAQDRHNENKAKLESLDAKMSDLREDFMYELGRGLDAIMEKMDSKEKVFEDCAKKVISLENDMKWVNRWVGAAWASIAAGFGLMLHHGGKH